MSAGILWGSFSPDSTNPDTGLEKAVGKKESLVHLARPWANGYNLDGSPRYEPFLYSSFDSVYTRGSLVLYDWFAWNLNNVKDPAFSLDRILFGDHDKFIHTWAQGAALWGKPLLVRFQSEMNGDWSIYGAQPSKLVLVWKKVVDIVRSEGGINVTWHWCPNVTAPSGTQWATSSDKLAAYYPGDDYVDWTGFDTYNWFVGNGSPWMTFDQVMNGYPGWYGPTYDTVSTIAPSKPMCIGEINSWNDPRKPSWWADALTVMPTHYPKVRAFSLFAPPFSEEGWLMQPDTLEAFKVGISTPFYVGGGQMEMPARGANIVPYEVRLPRPEPAHPDIKWEDNQKVVSSLNAALLANESIIRTVRTWRAATDNLSMLGS